MNAVTLRQVQREESIVCVGCHKTIRLIDSNHSVDKIMSDVNEGLDDLRRALKSLGAKV